jgi:hypothetical protein
MQLVQRLFFLLLLASCSVASQAQTSVLLINAGAAPLQVQRDDRSVMANVAPGNSATVTFSDFQWIQRGNMAYRYNTRNVQKLRNKGKNIVLQFDAKARMYLMPPQGGPGVASPPEQPKGFPLGPDRTFVLR